jgi:LysM repeat protein
MTKPRNPFIALIALVLVLACGTVPPTRTPLVFPTVATQQLVLNQTSAPSVLLISTNTPTGTLAGTPPYTLTSSHPDVLGIHVLRGGEWLYCIGRTYRVLPSAIANVNGHRSPYVIVPGQKLTVPNVP